MLEQTIIKSAEVKDRTAIGKDGTFIAKLEDGQEEMVRYTSPYGSGAKAGIIAVPEVGTPILVCQPMGTLKWYYMGSTFEPELPPKNSEVEGGKSILADEAAQSSSPFGRVDPNIAKTSGVVNKMLFKGNHGHGLEISDDKDGVSIMGVKTELTSSNGKKITMADSPGIDSIKLDSGNNASITLTQNPQDNPQKGAASIEIDSNGPQLHVCRESDMEVRVLGGGRELNIINSANGVPWGKIAGIPEPNPIATAGNVNIQSDRGDINLFANSPYTGRIFIETLAPGGARQFIKIGTAGPDGSIVLQANSIVLDATGPGGTIDINATAGVFINGGAGPVSTQGTSIETLATGPGGVNIEPGSGVVNLAGGAAAVPNSPRYVENTNPADIYKVDDYFGLGVF